MDKPIDTAQALDLNDDILRDLLDSEVILIGGGQVVGTCY